MPKWKPRTPSVLLKHRGSRQGRASDAGGQRGLSLQSGRHRRGRTATRCDQTSHGRFRLNACRCTKVTTGAPRRSIEWSLPTYGGLLTMPPSMLPPSLLATVRHRLRCWPGLVVRAGRLRRITLDGEQEKAGNGDNNPLPRGEMAVRARSPSWFVSLIP